MVFQFFGEKQYFIFFLTEGALMSLQLGRNVEERRGRVYGRWSIKF
jgi:hypothetical protein